ncbi:MAG: TIGR03016 family PEP-CTERM system-associated outer membrane protein, partial [Nitrosomonas sp.]|nr:TIGR03016 family PEP-CTERM system-associated outer membrane protein [Nitrosomonas sp.]
MKLFVCRNDSSSRWRGYLRIVCVVGLSSWIFQADAAEWSIQPRLTISETYTDNVGLGGGGFGGFGGSGRGGGEFITQINPGVNITGEGRRFKSSLNYTLNNL